MSNERCEQSQGPNSIDLESECLKGAKKGEEEEEDEEEGEGEVEEAEGEEENES